MGKRVVDIFSCREGDKLALNVVTDSGTTVVTEGTILNKYLIDKIIKMGIRKIYIYEDNENGNMDYIAFKKEYSKNVDAVKNILTELAAGKKLDLSLVAEISNEIKNI